MTDDEISFSPWDTEAGRGWLRRRRRRRRYLAAAAVLAAAATVAALVLTSVDHAVVPIAKARECAPGVPEVDVVIDNLTRETQRECIGITDSHDFRDPGLRPIVEKMKAENAAVGSDHVTVAVLGPLTAVDPRTEHQLAGIVAGQHRANQENLIGSRPKIKLVLANTDSRQSSWRPVVERLKRLPGLVAVVNTGLSRQETLDTATALAEVKMPMVGGVVTADGMDNTRVRGLARVNPRTDEQLSVLAKYLGTRKDLRTAMLVSSDNDDDLYTGALITAFKKHLGEYWNGQNYPFGGRPGDDFATIVRNLCGEDPPDMIFYAGRAADLPTFIDYLAKRNCHPGRITVLSGSDAVRLTLDLPENANTAEYLTRSHNPISVIYAPLVEPTLLARPPGPRTEAGARTAQLYADFVRAYRKLGFDPADLGTGWGIMGHDSMLVTASAIRLVKRPQGGPLRPAEIRNKLYLITTRATSVPGASGEITLDSNTGNRAGVRLPVLRLVPGRPPELLTPEPLVP